MYLCRRDGEIPGSFHPERLGSEAESAQRVVHRVDDVCRGGGRFRLRFRHILSTDEQTRKEGGKGEKARSVERERTGLSKGRDGERHWRRHTVLYSMRECLCSGGSGIDPRDCLSEEGRDTGKGLSFLDSRQQRAWLI
jgi:hypothetical protein